MKKKLKELLSESLPREELSTVYGSYDIVGDIPIIRLTSASEKNAAKIADALMSVHGNVKTVLAQTSPIAGEFQLRRLTQSPLFMDLNIGSLLWRGEQSYPEEYCSFFNLRIFLSIRSNYGGTA